VEVHFNLDGDTLMPYDTYLSYGKVHDVHGMAELCDESGVIYVLDRGYVDYKSLYTIDLQGSSFVIRMENNGVITSDVLIQLTGSKTKNLLP
jgi:hypothetical protein